MSEKRLSEDLKELYLLPGRNAKKVLSKNAISSISHKDHCHSLDVERKSQLSQFRKVKLELEQRLIRHAEDSLSLDEIKNLHKYVHDGKDEQLFCNTFRSNRQRSGSTASISSTLLSNSHGISNRARVKSVKNVTKNTCDDKEAVEENKYLMHCKLNTVNESCVEGDNHSCDYPLKLCTNVEDLVKGISKVPSKVPTLNPLEKNNEGENQRCVNKDESGSIAPSQGKQTEMGTSKEQVSWKQLTNYGSRRSISWDEGTRPKSQSSKDFPRLHQRRRSIDVAVMTGFHDSSEKPQRKTSLDFSKQRRDGVAEFLSARNSESDAKNIAKCESNIQTTKESSTENLRSGKEIPRKTTVKVYTEEPFYVRRRKQMTRKSSWQAEVMPDKAPKHFDDNKSETTICHEKTPLCDILPPILLPPIYYQNDIHENPKQLLQQRAQNQQQKQNNAQTSDRIQDCRYLRMPIRR